MEVEVKGW